MNNTNTQNNNTMSQQLQSAQGAQVPAAQQAPSLAVIKKKITDSVMNRIGDLQKEGGITIPKGYAYGNQINLAMLQLLDMKGKRGGPLLEEVEPASVCNSLLRMCIKGLSLEKKQFAFIQYGNQLQMQEEYHGSILLAKRLGGAGDPQAQVIYQDDVFEYEIDPKTGKKVVLKHEQKLANIDNAKIVGAWCLIPYRDHPDWQPKIEVMTMAEIRQAWMQNAMSKGQSPAHQKFTQEMAKKTVIGRACKLFYSTSDDAGLYEDGEVAQEAEFQEQPGESGTAANIKEAVFEDQQEPVKMKPLNVPAGKAVVMESPAPGEEQPRMKVVPEDAVPQGTEMPAFDDLPEGENAASMFPAFE